MRLTFEPHFIVSFRVNDSFSSTGLGKRGDYCYLTAARESPRPA